MLFLEGNNHPFKKEIHFQASFEKPTLVRVKLDNALYKDTTKTYQDIRLKADDEDEGYFIQKVDFKEVKNETILMADFYNREEAKLTYRFDEPFTIEEMDLHIEDRNFESMIDVYVNGKLISEKNKIYDYSNETGNRKFTIEIPKVKTDELTLAYHLDETTSFYKKYRSLQKMSQYLTIKSVTFRNNETGSHEWQKSEIKLQKSIINNEKKHSEYLFRTDNIPFVKVKVGVQEENFQRLGYFSVSEDAQVWQRVRDVSLLSSSLTNQDNRIIEFQGRSKYLKLTLFNRDNRPLTIDTIELFSEVEYLYFIAQPEKEYGIYFGDTTLEKPSYEIKSLVDNSSEYVEAKLLKTERLEVVKREEQISLFESYQKELFILVVILALIILSYIAFVLLKKSNQE
jgi:hypothetical protein